MKPTSTATTYPKLGIELRSYRGLVQPFSAHSHDDFVIGHVIEGSRDMIYDGKTYRVLSNDLLVFNPGDVHACTQHGKTPLEYVSLVIKANVIGKRRLQGPIVQDECATRAFDELASSLKANADTSEQRQLLRALLATLAIEDHETSDDLMANDVIDARATAKCTQHNLRAHVADYPSLDALASAQGLSKYQLLRAYKKHYAITPLAHLSSFKIERACDLLAHGVAPGKVAMHLGFADQAHLTRVFKQQIGMTPGAYQHMIVESAGANR